MQTTEGGTFSLPPQCYDCRVLKFKQLIPAEPPHRKKHLIQVFTDPGGLRTLSVGSIQLKDPKRSAAAKRRHAEGR